MAYPRSNGQIEVMNWDIVQGLKVKLDQAQGNLVNELLEVLWAHQTTPKSSYSETPFSLIYDLEVILPAKIGVQIA